MFRKQFVEEKKSLRETFHKNTENFVGIGLTDAAEGAGAHENAIVVYVSKLTPKHEKGKKHTFVDGQKIDVKYVEVGDIQLTGYTGRFRPYAPGAAVGAQGSNVKGTIGAFVTDNTDGSTVLLSASHVIASFGNLPLGTPTLQPGPGNGGVPADRIGQLKRFVPNQIFAGGINYVDVAISSIDDTTEMQVNPFCTQVKPDKHGAVGMLYGASSAITILNPIDNITTMMNVTFPKTKTATVGMQIHACTAVTGYISTTVSAILVDLLLGNVWWLDQITCPGGIGNGTAGDSGAMFYTKFNV